MDKPRLLDRVRAALRARHYSLRTEEAYVGGSAATSSSTASAIPTRWASPRSPHSSPTSRSKRHVAASTQNQALSALLFLYRDVLGRPLDSLGDVVRARRPERLPVVLSRAEVKAVLSRLDGAPCLVASLLYGSGLRAARGARLRVKDLDFDRNQILVRDGKGQKDRVTMLPVSLEARPRPPPRDRAAAGTKSTSASRRRRRRPPRRPPPEVPARRASLGAGSTSFPHRASASTREAAPGAGTTFPRPSRQASRRCRRYRQARDLPHPAALLRHPPSRDRHRHPDDPGAPRPQATSRPR